MAISERVGGGGEMRLSIKREKKLSIEREEWSLVQIVRQRFGGPVMGCQLKGRGNKGGTTKRGSRWV